VKWVSTILFPFFNEIYHDDVPAYNYYDHRSWRDYVSLQHFKVSFIDHFYFRYKLRIIIIEWITSISCLAIMQMWKANSQKKVTLSEMFNLVCSMTIISVQMKRCECFVWLNLRRRNVGWRWAKFFTKNI